MGSYLKEAQKKQIYDNYTQTQALFTGNKDCPVTRSISMEEVVEILNDAASSGRAQQPAIDLLRMMLEEQWCITASVHRGGFGGIAGDADPEPHISLAVGNGNYHLRLADEKYSNLYDISGPNLQLSKGKEIEHKRTNPPAESQVDALVRQYHITEKQALAAISKYNREQREPQGGQAMTMEYICTKWLPAQRS
ncbi:MAG: hypothetical protein M3Z08_16080 [Chloroflexota bacterium]|nr:hypothetical protein [Chloroflexota bacterium]